MTETTQGPSSPPREEREASPAILTVHDLAGGLTELLASFLALPDEALSEEAHSALLATALFPFSVVGQDAKLSRYEYVMAVAAAADESWEFASGTEWHWTKGEERDG